MQLGCERGCLGDKHVERRDGNASKLYDRS